MNDYFKMDKDRVMRLYTEYIRWSILLSIRILKRIIRNNEFAHQKYYWLNELKECLQKRKLIFERLKSVENEQMIFEF